MGFGATEEKLFFQRKSWFDCHLHDRCVPVHAVQVHCSCRNTDDDCHIPDINDVNRCCSAPVLHQDGTEGGSTNVGRREEIVHYPTAKNTCRIPAGVFVFECGECLRVLLIDLFDLLFDFLLGHTADLPFFDFDCCCL